MNVKSCNILGVFLCEIQAANFTFLHAAYTEVRGYIIVNLLCDIVKADRGYLMLHRNNTLLPLVESTILAVQEYGGYNDKQG